MAATMRSADRIHRQVLIVGAGPAGLTAANLLATLGAQVILVDENPGPGGAIHRQPFPGSRRAAAAPLSLDPRVEFLGRTVCYGLVGSHMVLSTAGDSEWRTAHVSYDALMIATGAHEHVVPFPGNTLQGVITCGGAQTLMKGSGCLPGKSIVVAGNGPLLLATAAQLLDAIEQHSSATATEATSQLVRVVEASRLARHAGVHAAAALVRTPAHVIKEGLGYAQTIRRHRVPVTFGRAVVRASADDDGRIASVTTARLDTNGQFEPETELTTSCDALVLGDGFASNVDLAQQAGATIAWEQSTRTWTPVRNDSCETSVPGIFAVGDCAGIGGHLIAENEANIAASAIARRLGLAAPDALVERRARTALRRLRRFRDATEKLYEVPSGADRSLPESIVCRCENVTRARIDAAIGRGATDFRTSKLMTRAGMGICQGRTCMCAIRDLIAASGNATPVEPPQAQFPVRPMPLATGAALIADSSPATTV